jgi:hypothetical protein
MIRFGYSNRRYQRPEWIGGANSSASSGLGEGVDLVGVYLIGVDLIGMYNTLSSAQAIPRAA